MLKQSYFRLSLHRIIASFLMETKKTIALIYKLIVLCLSMKMQAQSPQVLRMDSIADVFIADQKYDQALTTLYRELEVLESAHPDSMYIAALIKISQCYEKQGIPMKAIEQTKRALDLYGESHPTDDIVKAQLYDCLSLYYHSMRNFPEAYRWSCRAVALFDQLPCRTDHRIDAFCHASTVAVSYSYFDEAIKWQAKAAELGKNTYGGHSDEYLALLGDLKRRYMAAKDNKHADELATLHLKLTREVRDGFLPPPADLSTPAKCRRHNRDALMCSRWLLKHRLTADSMSQAIRYVIQYCKQTPDVTFYFGPVEKKWTKHANRGYLVAYMAASAEYALTHQDDLRWSLEQYKYAIKRLIDYYEENKKQTGSVWTFENYINLRNKHPMLLEQRLEKDFEDYKTYMRNNKGGSIDVDNLKILGVFN